MAQNELDQTQVNPGFKRSMNHHCILLEVLSDSKNEEKIQKMQFWYPVAYIVGIDIKDVIF
jgi:hypothetical protein